MELDWDDSYDDDFENSPCIKLLPYIGEGYHIANPKILILGESRYWENDVELPVDEIRHYICDYVEEATKGNRTIPNWTHGKPCRNTASMITGKDKKNSDDKWYEMAYYVFFQDIIGKISKDKSLITKELIEQSQKAYIDVIKILQPQLIIVWGIGQLYNEWVPQRNREIIDKENIVYKYTDFPDTIIWHIAHPSWENNFSLEDYQERYLSIKNKYLNKK